MSTTSRAPSPSLLFVADVISTSKDDVNCSINNSHGVCTTNDSTAVIGRKKRGRPRKEDSRKKQRLFDQDFLGKILIGRQYAHDMLMLLRRSITKSSSLNTSAETKSYFASPCGYVVPASSSYENNNNQHYPQQQYYTLYYRPIQTHTTTHQQQQQQYDNNNDNNDNNANDTHENRQSDYNQWLNDYSLLIRDTATTKKDTATNTVVPPADNDDDDNFDFTTINFETLWSKYLKPLGWRFDKDTNTYTSPPRYDSKHIVSCSPSSNSSQCSAAEQLITGNRLLNVSFLPSNNNNNNCSSLSLTSTCSFSLLPLEEQKSTASTITTADRISFQSRDELVQFLKVTATPCNKLFRDDIIQCMTTKETKKATRSYGFEKDANAYCEVCFSLVHNDSDHAPLVKCEKCKLLVHADCYFDYNTSNPPGVDRHGYFTCQVCYSTTASSEQQHYSTSENGLYTNGLVYCQLCLRKDVAGGMVQTSSKHEWVHLSCMMASRNLYIRRKRVYGISKELKDNASQVKEICRSRGILNSSSNNDSITCNVCSSTEKGYLLACENTTCHLFFHPLCAELIDCSRKTTKKGYYSYKCVQCTFPKKWKLECCCSVCGKFDGRSLIECDTCKKGFHTTTCIHPPIYSIPKESWSCSQCLSENKQQNLLTFTNPLRLLTSTINRYPISIQNNNNIHDVSNIMLKVAISRTFRVMEAMCALSQLFRDVSEKHPSHDDDGVLLDSVVALPMMLLDDDEENNRRLYFYSLVHSRQGEYIDMFTLLLAIFQSSREWYSSSTIHFRPNAWKFINYTIHFMYSNISFYQEHGYMSSNTLNSSSNSSSSCSTESCDKVIALAGMALSHLLLDENLVVVHQPNNGLPPQKNKNNNSNISKAATRRKDGPKTKKVIPPKLNDATTLLSTDAAASSNVVQLFADFFSNTNSHNEDTTATTTTGISVRSKRTIKVTPRFDSSNYPAVQKFKVGEGFLCPRCDEVCQYDCKKCLQCGLLCQYCAGVGVVVCKDRNEIISTTAATSNWRNETSKGTSIATITATNQATQTQLPSKGSATVTYYQLTKQQQQQSPKKLETKEDRKAKVECEVCMKFIAYVGEHRNRHHGLKRNEAGCPFCNCKFRSWKLRNSHIIDTHLERNVNRCLLKLPTGQTDWQDIITGTTSTTEIQCPLCFDSEKFVSVSDLHKHLDDTHTFLRYIDPVDGSMYRYELFISLQSRLTDQTKEPRQIVLRKKMVFGDGSDSRSTAEILKDIENQLKYVKAQVDNTTTTLNFDEDDLGSKEYNEDMKVFKKHLSQRARGSEQERHEASNFHAKQKLRLMHEAYASRITKRTEAEVMIDKFCMMPIRITHGDSDDDLVTNGTTTLYCKTAAPSCQIKGCRLCSGDFAKVLLTDEEMQAAGGDFEKAIDVFNNNYLYIPRPPVVLASLSSAKEDDDDWAIDNDAHHESKESQLLNEWIRLNRIKFQVRFIERYNNGLLRPMKEGC